MWNLNGPQKNVSRVNKDFVWQNWWKNLKKTELRGWNSLTNLCLPVKWSWNRWDACFKNVIMLSVLSWILWICCDDVDDVHCSCAGCGSEVSKEDSFYELLLNIRGHRELSECLKEFFQVSFSVYQCWICYFFPVTGPTIGNNHPNDTTSAPSLPTVLQYRKTNFCSILVPDVILH